VKSLLNFKIEDRIVHIVNKNINNIKLFIILFTINIIIFGQKLYFHILSTDDYERFFSSNGGGEQASWLGRWMAGVLNQNIFNDALCVLPYLYDLIGIFSFTLVGFLTAKILKREKISEIVIVTLLISATPFFAHNLYFTINISAWITTLLGVLGLYFMYKPNIFGKIFSFILLVTAIGSYQAIVQVAIAIVIMRTVIDVLEIKKREELMKTLFHSMLLMVFIFFAFAASNIINYLYIEYNNLTINRRYKKLSDIKDFDIYFHRFKDMFHDKIDLFYFSDILKMHYKLISLFGVFSAFLVLLNSQREKIVIIISILFFEAIFLIIPYVMNLPMIAGYYIPVRAHYAIGWFIAGFFVLQMLAFKGIFKTMSSLLAISLIIISIVYINVYYYAGYRQTSSDIIRANQIVSRIRADKNYVSEPIKFKVIGKKPFTVTGWNPYQQALNTEWSKTKIFKEFTDLNFENMSNEEYSEIESYLADRGEMIYPYPGKNSIAVYKDKAVLFLSADEILSKLFINKRSKDTLYNSNEYFDFYLIENMFCFYKKNPSDIDKESIFVLNIFPQDIKDLPDFQQKRGKEYMEIKPNGIVSDEEMFLCMTLPSYKIKSIRTSQHNATGKRLWETSFDINNSLRQ
jgi:hypothetical protein